MVQIFVTSGQTSMWVWLGPVLLFSASLVASGVAYCGIRKTNETTRAAITATDNREMEKWRRETLLKLTSDAAIASLDIVMLIRNTARATTPAQLVSTKWRDDIGEAGKRLRDTAEHLSLIGAADLSTLCTSIFAAIKGIVDPFADLVVARAEMQQQLKKLTDALEEPSTTAKEEIEKGLRAKLVAGPQDRFDAAMTALKTARRKFVAQAQRELNPVIQKAEPPSALPQEPAQEVD